MVSAELRRSGLSPPPAAACAAAAAATPPAACWAGIQLPRLNGPPSRAAGISAPDAPPTCRRQEGGQPGGSGGVRSGRRRPRGVPGRAPAGAPARQRPRPAGRCAGPGGFAGMHWIFQGGIPCRGSAWASRGSGSGGLAPPPGRRVRQGQVEMLPAAVSRVALQAPVNSRTQRASRAGPRKRSWPRAPAPPTGASGGAQTDRGCLTTPPLGASPMVLLL